MSKKSMRHDSVVVGLALFAMFLGAANIIFPPFLGARAGSLWFLAALGFIIAGTGLPVLGIIATARAGGQANDIANRVSPKFSIILNTLLLIFIGPLFAIPRTAATTVELSVIPFMPAAWNPFWIKGVGCFIFCVIAVLFVINPSNTLDKVGKYLTPILVAFLLTLIAISIVKPPGRPIATLPDMLKNGIFNEGFTTGYQTMDALASIVFCTTVFMTLKEKGYTGSDAKKMMIPVALISGCGTALVYGGFIWIGASGSAWLQTFAEHTSLTVHAVQLLAGVAGKIILALIIFFACCTTAIGILVTASTYFFRLFKGRIQYRVIVFINAVISCGIAIIGVDGIIRLAAPFLEVMYPIVIILIVLNLFGRRIKYNFVFHGSLICAFPFMIMNVLKMFETTKPFAVSVLAPVPLGPEGFGTLIPAVVGGIIGSIIARVMDRKGKLAPRFKLQPLKDKE